MFLVEGDIGCISRTLRQVTRNDIPVVGDCPDFRGGSAERNWDCPLHTFRLGVGRPWYVIFWDLPNSIMNKARTPVRFTHPTSN
jgi:hypothetical protein